jgi:deoxyribonuclease-4
LYAAGYDIATAAGFEETMQQFDKIVGRHLLKAMHLNDSKAARGSHLDRHELIGKGHIGLEGFRYIMTEPRFQQIPLILETPGDNDIWKGEIALLHSLTAKK